MYRRVTAGTYVASFLTHPKNLDKKKKGNKMFSKKIFKILSISFQNFNFTLSFLIFFSIFYILPKKCVCAGGATFFTCKYVIWRKMVAAYACTVLLLYITYRQISVFWLGILQNELSFKVLISQFYVMDIIFLVVWVPLEIHVLCNVSW